MSEWALAHPYLTCFIAYCVLHVVGIVAIHVVDGVRDVLKAKANVKSTEAMFRRGGKSE